MHWNVDNSSLFVNGKVICKFKANNRNVDFLNQFCLGSISNGFSGNESKEVSFKENVHDFLVDYKAIEKCDILDIHKYLTKKDDIV